ncbi:hypothetical protein ILYODFUR_020588 [Ilyodon furcidens]|uniref:Uncharacterized protein n=1 Tax=Ilyodon furcidens TaxID=33524 RepID=A0ABV0TDJ9_9TELE
MTLAGQRTMKLPAGEAVHHVMTFDPNDRNFLYVMTSHHMLRVKVAECDQWKSCTDCLGAGDAYCGWCTLENRLGSNIIVWSAPLALGQPEGRSDRQGAPGEE